MVERVLAVAVNSCSLFTGRAQQMVHPNVDMALQAHARSFPSLRGGPADEEEAIDWTVLVLYLTIDKGSAA